MYRHLNLVRRLCNILEEAKRPQDIDNTHVKSLIERKMTKDDLKVGARHIYLQKLEPSMSNLLKWMEKEMTAQLRSGAAIRKTGSLTSSSINVLGVSGDTNSSHNVNKAKNQCYVWKANHYVDECPRFQAMTPDEQRWS